MTFYVETKHLRHLVLVFTLHIMIILLLHQCAMNLLELITSQDLLFSTQHIHSLLPTYLLTCLMPYVPVKSPFCGVYRGIGAKARVALITAAALNC